ncbi:Octapeptide-repeat protein T2, partial [Ophiophagus hannah]
MNVEGLVVKIRGSQTQRGFKDQRQICPSHNPDLLFFELTAAWSHQKKEEQTQRNMQACIEETAVYIQRKISSVLGSFHLPCQSRDLHLSLKSCRCHLPSPSRPSNAIDPPSLLLGCYFSLPVVSLGEKSDMESLALPGMDISRGGSGPEHVKEERGEEGKERRKGGEKEREGRRRGRGEKRGEGGRGGVEREEEEERRGREGREREGEEGRKRKGRRERGGEERRWEGRERGEERRGEGRKEEEEGWGRVGFKFFSKGLSALMTGWAVM